MSTLTNPSFIEITEGSVAALRLRIQAEPGTLYAILDACDEPRVPQKVLELGSERGVSLYRGWAERDYFSIAPYLVQVDEQLFDWIIENLGEDPWGIFVIAPTDLTALRKHFRRFLMVQDPDGKKIYFRFYDPRVLPTFLTTCTGGECSAFFGPVTDFFVCEDGHLRQIGRKCE